MLIMAFVSVVEYVSRLLPALALLRDDRTPEVSIRSELSGLLEAIVGQTRPRSA